MYSSIHLGRGMPQPPLVGFIHLPLTMQQAAAGLQPLASMDVRTMASAIRLLLVDLAENFQASKGRRATKQELA
jgi:pyrrolidone-carboxylate peptidase